MKTYNFWVIPAIILGLASLTASNEAGCSRTGIKGHVYLVKGNQMPSPDRKPSTPAGLETELYVYALTSIDQVKRVGITAFYSEVNTSLITTAKTDASGAFSVKLPPGTYSLFIKKGENYYANLFDDKNNIFPVEVVQGKMTEVEFKADYDAVY
ncbi:MAG: hypothetical protein ACTHMV_19320 [Chitinophagaceae bacterium]